MESVKDIEDAICNRRRIRIAGAGRKSRDPLRVGPFSCEGLHLWRETNLSIDISWNIGERGIPFALGDSVEDVKAIGGADR